MNVSWLQSFPNDVCFQNKVTCRVSPPAAELLRNRNTFLPLGTPVSRSSGSRVMQRSMRPLFLVQAISLHADLRRHPVTDNGKTVAGQNCWSCDCNPDHGLKFCPDKNTDESFFLQGEMLMSLEGLKFGHQTFAVAVCSIVVNFYDFTPVTILNKLFEQQSIHGDVKVNWTWF